MRALDQSIPQHVRARALIWVCAAITVRLFVQCLAHQREPAWIILKLAARYRSTDIIGRMMGFDGCVMF